MKNLLLEHLGLPADAAEWLSLIFDAAQTFDDYADGDEVTRERLDALIWNTMVTLPNHPFYTIHRAALQPILALTILKWQASDTVERKGEPTAMSYSWRAGYYDIVLIVCTLCFGSIQAAKMAHKVMALYDEKFEDYIEEIRQCQIQSRE